MSGPTPENRPEAEDPFADLGESPVLESLPEESAEAEEVAIDDVAAEPVSPTPPPPVAAKRSRTGLRVLLACTVLFVGALGWLGWSYMQDREALETLVKDVLAARDAANASSTRTDDAGEAAKASALKVRVAELVDSPWWDRVVVRIIDADRIEAMQAETTELASDAAARAKNRIWWKEISEAARSALADESRTIPGVTAAADTFAEATEPNAGAGGFDPEARTEVIGEFENNSNALLDAQNATLAQWQGLLDGLRAAATLEALATGAEALDAPLPIDRNPPELESAMRRMREQTESVRQFLESRDEIQRELDATLVEINAFSLEDGSLAAMTAMRDRLAALELPDDARFDAPRTAAATAADAASAVADALAARDEALAWVASRRDELDMIRSLEAMAEFAERLTTDSPESDNPRVLAAAEDLLARIGVRTAALQEEQRLLEESNARAALFDGAAAAAEQAFKEGRVSAAAQATVGAAAETPDQARWIVMMRDVFAERAHDSMRTMREAAMASGQWEALASELRAALASADVAALVPTFAMECNPLWVEASAEEDRSVYDDVRRLAHSPHAELAAAATRYLDPARLRGGTAPMAVQVARLLEVTEHPGVALEVEGVEWGDVGCEWNSPQTSMTLTIDDEPLQFELGMVSPLETSLLRQEAWISKGREESVRFGLNGFFDCADDDGVFVGSGELLMDDLRCGGRLALPFWNDGDQSGKAHQLLLVAIPDDAVRVASDLPIWIDPRPAAAPPAEVTEEPAPADVEPAPAEAAPVEPAAVEPQAPPVDPTDPSNPNAAND